MYVCAWAIPVALSLSLPLCLSTLPIRATLTRKIMRQMNRQLKLPENPVFLARGPRKWAPLSREYRSPRQVRAGEGSPYSVYKYRAGAASVGTDPSCMAKTLRTKLTLELLPTQKVRQSA